ncbi:hypothetical protein QQX98_000700 [Neonectria punicea]|uniref:Uncharacterized protein n=1 Tax=Neonectria punicea TaxID=979145 RepID=A0ABR1HSB2_9HYPO
MITDGTGEHWGAKAGLFYAGTNLLWHIWCWLRLPETKDCTFGELDVLFDNEIPARTFKHTEVDQFAQQSNYALKKDDLA